jgi:uncharacterized protein
VPTGPLASAPVPEVWLIALTLAVGFVTGTLSGMFGVGGAVISNPGVRALGASPLEAVGSTLPSIIPSSITGSIRYARAGLILSRVVVGTGVAGAFAAVAGALAAEQVPGDGHVLMLTVALLMGVTALRMGRSPSAAERSGVEHLEPALVDHSWWRPITIGVIAGAMSGLLGIGGGILMVPLFTVWLRLDVKQAVGTSLACVGLLAVPGTLTHSLLGHVRWSFAIPLAIGAIPGAWIGARITIGAKERTVRLVVALLLGSIAGVYGLIEVIALVRATS